MRERKKERTNKRKRERETIPFKTSPFLKISKSNFWDQISRLEI